MHNNAVLLVDDDVVLRESLGAYLARNNYHVKTAASGEAALAELQDSCVDMVITDVVMVGISGIELLREIKRTNREISVIILTGMREMQLAIEALRAGAEDFFLKPFDVDELIASMQRISEKQEAQRKIQRHGQFLPVCMYCKQIRDDQGKEWGRGEWLKMEKYLHKKCGLDVSHGCCPDCIEKMKDDWFNK